MAAEAHGNTVLVEVSEASENFPLVRIAREYFRGDEHPTNRLILHNVQTSAKVTADDYSRLSKKYEGTLSLKNVVLEIEATQNIRSVAEVILSYARKIHPTLVIVGMAETASRRERLGSVAHHLIHNILYHVYVVRSTFVPKGPGKKYLLCLDGSPVSIPSIHSLLKLINPKDEIIAITMSFHNGANDARIIGEARSILEHATNPFDASQPMGWKHAPIVQYRPRERALNLGEQICAAANELAVDVIACAPGSRGMAQLGSVSSYIVNNAPVDVLILKEIILTTA